jgi:O-antigen/teichoic acid export membrane protein
MKFVKITINQVFYKLLVTLANQLSTLISIVILANYISALEFGKVAICLLLLQSFWFLSEWGIPNYSIELLASKSSKAKKKDFLKTIIAFHFICFGFFLLLLALLIKFIFLDLNFKFYLTIIPCLFFGIFNFFWFFSLINKVEKIVIVTIIARGFLIGSLFFLGNNADGYLYLTLYGISFGIIALYSVYQLIKMGYLENIPSMKHLFMRLYYLKSSSLYFFTNLTDNQLPLIWSFVISITGGAPLVFLYTLADQIFRAVIAISVFISQTIRINLSLESKDDLFFTIKLFTVLGIIFSVIGYCYIEDFLRLFFNDNFSDPIRFTSFIVLPASLHYFIRLLNYPLLAEYYDLKFVNKISFMVFYLSLFLLGCWAIFYESLVTLIIMMSFSLFAHLLIIIFLLSKKIKVT